MGWEEILTSFLLCLKRMEVIDYNYKRIPLLVHPKNERGVFLSLVEKYQKFGTLYIGVDFDNTIRPYDWRNGEDKGFVDIINLLGRAKRLGMKLCLWTLPTSDENLEWKIEWCKENDIEMDYINDSPILKEYSEGRRKPHFNLLLDDVAGLESAYSILTNVCDFIEFHSK